MNTKLTANNRRQTKEILQELFGSVYRLEPRGGFRFRRVELSRDNCRELQKKLNDAQRMSDILRDLKATGVLGMLQPEARSMNKMLVYLGLVESLGVALMDTVLFLLVANGEEIHTKQLPPRHIKSFNELGDLDLNYKLDVLEHANIEIFRRIVNREIRNKVGHLKFVVNEDGIIKDAGKNEIPIDEAISDFWLGVSTVLLILEEIGFMKWLDAEARKP